MRSSATVATASVLMGFSVSNMISSAIGLAMTNFMKTPSKTHWAPPKTSGKSRRDRFIVFGRRRDEAVRFVWFVGSSKRLSANGDPLEELGRIVDFEAFRALLETALAYSDGKKGGRPPMIRWRCSRC